MKQLPDWIVVALAIAALTVLPLLLGFPIVAAWGASVVAMLLGWVLWNGFRARARRPLDAGAFPYVYVDDNRDVRELTADERVYLDTRFEGGDGGAPHIKPWYGSRNALGFPRGFLRREQVPPHVAIGPARESTHGR